MRCRTLFVVSAGVAFAATTVSAGDAPLVSSPEKKRDEETVVLSPFSVKAGFGGYLGATPGGFQDVSFGRELLKWGMLPRAAEITAEGLFSEYDLPTPEADTGARLLMITGDAKAAAMLDQPEVTHLAQIGFSSGLDPRTWRRDAVLLVAVADVSGSMEGSLPLLKKSIEEVLAQLRPDDAFALVAFSNHATLELPPMLASTASLESMVAAIAGLKTGGGTNIESGLKLGFTVARTTLEGFTGRRRVMLITDAGPNIGATGPESFMTQAEQASLAGVGLTTIGVGLDFSAEFVKRVSSVSGGNAFYFADAEQMQKRLGEDFDFMVTELAFDVQIRIDPAPGFRVIDVYGLPGDAYVRTPEGGIVMDLPTLFLSRERGAIFLTFAGDASRARLGQANLSYGLYGAKLPETSAFDLVVRSETDAGVGLVRGELLINEVAMLRAASAALYDDGDIQKARAHAAVLRDLFRGESDRALRREMTMIENVVAFLDRAADPVELSARGLRARPRSSPLLGVWRFVAEDGREAPGRFLVLMPGGRAGFLDSPDDFEMRMLPWKGRRIGRAGETMATLALTDDNLTYLAMPRGEPGVEWRLVRCEPADVWQTATRSQ